MLFNVCHKLHLKHWIKLSIRSQSTKLTFTPKLNLQEFSFNTYDCVGFDLDHTLSRYRLKPLFNLIYKTLASYLIKKYGYSEHLSELCDSDIAFGQKGIVLDKSRGNFLKLDGDYRIVKASHGTRPLSLEDISKIYGQECIWEESKGIPHKLVSTTALEEPFYVFKDYFVTPGAVICAKMVDLIDQIAGEKVKSYNFWDHYIDGIYYMYDRHNFKNDVGEFFPELKRHPEHYFQPCSEKTKEWLENMCSSKVTFLLTSSNYDSAEFIAEYCLGKDWRKYFDVIVTFARKPGFFWRDKPFYLVKNNAETHCQTVQSNSVYSQGNFKELRELCASLSKTKNPKILYFGDSLIEDVYAASEIAGCDSVAIVEEMMGEGIDATTLISPFWGSFFSSCGPEDAEYGSLWAHILSKHSKLTIPSLDSISGLQLEKKVLSCGNEVLTAGYFPAIPKSLA